MRTRITKRVVDEARPGARRSFIWDTEVTGFGLKVTRAGKKSYVFQYRVPGQGRQGTPRRLRLGRHGELTPDQARRLAAGMLLAVRAGEDPQKARRPEKSPTVEELARRFLAEYLPGKARPPRAKTVEDYQSIFRCHVLPALGRKPVAAVTRADLELLHRQLRHMPYQANRVLAVLHQAFSQAEAWGWRQQHSNPAVHIDRYPEERRGAKQEVMLSAEEMGRLLNAIAAEEAADGNAIACAAIRVAFWTGWRISEVLGLEWRSVDLPRGHAKLVKTKTAAEEHRQLPAEAVSVLAGVTRVEGCLYVFPGRDFRNHLTTVRTTWTRVRERAGLDRLEGLGALRLHDLRHNVVSWDVSRGVALEIAGKNVGHRSREATEVYAHFAPDALKRAADERAHAMKEAIQAKGEARHE